MLVEPATRGEAAVIVGLMRQSFDAPTRQLMVYDCAGIEHFVADQLALGALSPYRYRVVRDGGRIAAAAELRARQDTLFLNYIAVDPSTRGKGLGKALIRTAVAEALREALTTFALDVFESNVRAIRLYEAIGMRVVAKRMFWSRAPETASPERARLIVDYPQAESVHLRLGFSEITLDTGDRLATVGRLGSRYFRLLGADLADDTDLRRSLSRLDPARHFLAILESPPRRETGWTLLASSWRMSAPLRDVKA